VGKKSDQSRRRGVWRERIWADGPVARGNQITPMDLYSGKTMRKRMAGDADQGMRLDRIEGKRVSSGPRRRSFQTETTTEDRAFEQ
jgi:hypothetical protein